MSLFAIQRLIFDLKRDKLRSGLLKSEPQTALGDADLTDEEQRALVSGDLAALYRMGVHPLLLRPFSRMVEISPIQYQQLLNPLRGTRTFSSEYRLDSHGDT